MKELALKYGCNPNQKPSRIYKLQFFLKFLLDNRSMSCYIVSVS